MYKRCGRSKEYMREWVIRNREHIKEYRNQTKEKRNKRRRELYQADPKRRERACQSATAYRLQHPYKRKDYELRKNYGITLEQYYTLLISQDKRCAICQCHLNIKSQIHVDHSHVTGKVRGILCGQCNLAIGKFHDDPNLLEKAANYLREHQ